MPLSAVAARRLATQKGVGDKQEANYQSTRDIIKPIEHQFPDREDESHTEPWHGKKIGKHSRKRKQSRVLSDSPDADTKAQITESDKHEPVTSVAFSQQSAFSTRIHINNEVDRDASSMDIDLADPLPSESQESSYESDLSTEAENYETLESNPTAAVDLAFTTVQKSSVTHTVEGGRKTSIVKFTPGQQVVCVGSFDLWVRKGSVALLGALIHASSKVYRVFAPSSHSLPVIKAAQNPTVPGVTSAEIALIHSSNGMKCLENLNPVFARLWSDSKSSFHILYRALDDNFKRPLNLLQELGTWHSLALKLLDPQMTESPKIAVCGPKGSGKSTMARFLCNALLSSGRWDAVAFLDIDPGQPEYSLCGELSLSLIRNFNFGPPFTHAGSMGPHSARIWTQLYGSNTPRDDPEYYVDCVKDLYNRFRDKYALRYPLIINFSGWIFADGIKALESCIDLIAPTDIVYMNIEDLGERSISPKLITRDSSAILHTITTNTSHKSSKSSADLRVMHTISYFHSSETRPGDVEWSQLPLDESLSQEWFWTDDGKCFDGVMCYTERVSLGKLEHLLESAVISVIAVEKNRSVEIALDAYDLSKSEDEEPSAVFWRDSRLEDPGLANFSEAESKDANGDIVEPLSLRLTGQGVPFLSTQSGFNVTLDPSTSHVLGQAFVKKVDGEKRAIELVTPLTREVLIDARKKGSKILLVKGRSDMPSWALLEPYYTAVAAQTQYKHDKSAASLDDENDMSDTGTDDGIENENRMWPAQKLRIQALDRASLAIRRRMKPWRLRRNLETFDAKTR